MALSVEGGAVSIAKDAPISSKDLYDIVEGFRNIKPDVQSQPLFDSLITCYAHLGIPKCQ